MFSPFPHDFGFPFFPRFAPMGPLVFQTFVCRFRPHACELDQFVKTSCLALSRAPASSCVFADLIKSSLADSFPVLAIKTVLRRCDVRASRASALCLFCVHLFFFFPYSSFFSGFFIPLTLFLRGRFPGLVFCRSLLFESQAPSMCTSSLLPDPVSCLHLPLDSFTSGSTFFLSAFFCLGNEITFFCTLRLHAFPFWLCLFGFPQCFNPVIASRKAPSHLLCAGVERSLRPFLTMRVAGSRPSRSVLSSSLSHSF